MTILASKLIAGDCLAALKDMPEASVDAVVTDPPYGISFMGKRWDYDVPAVEVWAECLRVLKPGGHLLAFAGTRTQHRMAVRIEDAGFEIRDMLAWVYGSGFPKSLNLGGGRGTALKPAIEPITLARKPLAGTVADTVEAWGTGALNIDACRIAGDDAPEGRTRHGGGIPGNGTSYELPDSNGQMPAGRWPANLIHDGSGEVESIFPAGSARFFYCAKATMRDRDSGLRHRALVAREEITARKPGTAGAVNPRAGRRSSEGYRNTHPTVKPTPLMRYLCRLVTPPGGVVLDPFMGSGSTGKAAILEGFSFIGVEREPEYLEIAASRIQAAERRAAKRKDRTRPPEEAEGTSNAARIRAALARLRGDRRREDP